MQAVILAGGLGTRLGRLTRETPKPMVGVAGRPYLEYQLLALRDQAITDVVLLTGYLGEQIEDYFGDGRELGLRIRYSRESSPQGTGGALRSAGSLLADHFLLLYGDSYLPIDYCAVLDKLAASPALGCLVAYDNRLDSTNVTNNLALSNNDVVLRYAKDALHATDLTYVEAGVHAYRRDVLTVLSATGKVSLETEVFPQLIARAELIAYRTTQRFYDIGTPERLCQFERLFTHDHHAYTLPH